MTTLKKGLTQAAVTPAATAVPVKKEYTELRVWWIPQVGRCKPFHYKVRTLAEGKLLLDALAEYDLFQLKNNIKPDFANIGGLSVFSQPYGGWVDFYDIDGNEITDFTMPELVQIGELQTDDEQWVQAA